MTRDTFDLFTPSDRGRFGDNESAPPAESAGVAADQHDLELVFHYTTGRAIQVSLDGNQARAEWLPLSLIKFATIPGAYVMGTRRDGQQCQFQRCKVTLPERLAKEKGLL